MAILIRNNRHELELETSLGVKVPITRSSKIGIFDSTTTTLEKCKSQLYVLLFTERGERVMLPDFGVNLQKSLFENIDEILLGEIRKDIRVQAAKYIQEIDIKEINFNQVENTLELEIKFALKGNEMQYDKINVVIR